MDATEKMIKDKAVKILSWLGKLEVSRGRAACLYAAASICMMPGEGAFAGMSREEFMNLAGELYDLARRTLPNQA